MLSITEILWIIFFKEKEHWLKVKNRYLKVSSKMECKMVRVNG